MTELLRVIGDQVFSKANPLPRFWNRQVLQFCTLDGLEIYDSMEGMYAGCTFMNTLYYWTLWNCASTSDSAFDSCIFQGVSFSGSHFVKTSFVNCKFALDNLGGQCKFSDSIFVQCEFKNCEFVVHRRSDVPIFENSKFYDCAFEDCQGLDSFP